MRTILMISLAATLAAPAAGWAQTEPDWTVRDWNEPAPNDPAWTEPAWETRARREQGWSEPGWEERDRGERDRSEPAWDDRHGGEDASSEHAWREGERDWNEGEAAPILTSPLRADEIPPVEETEPEPDEAAAPPDESSSESAWPEPGEAQAPSAESAGQPSSDVAPWDEPTAPVATGPDARRMSRWGEIEPPQPEPAPPSERGEEPPASPGY